MCIGPDDSCSKMSCVIKHTHTQCTLNWEPGSSGLSLNIQLMPVLHQKNIQAMPSCPFVFRRQFSNGRCFCKCVAHSCLLPASLGEKHSLNVGYYHVGQIVSEMFYAGYDQLGSSSEEQASSFPLCQKLRIWNPISFHPYPHRTQNLFTERG